MKYLLLTLLLLSLGGFGESEVYEGELLNVDGLVYKPRSLEPFTGKNVLWHRYSQLLRKGGYRDGKEDGLWEFYWNNGQLESKGNYSDGNREGLWVFYWNNGQLENKGNYIDGNRDGLWEYYHENGQPWAKGSYKDGKEDGLWECYEECYEKDGSVSEDYPKCYQNGKEVNLSICKQ